MKTTIDTYETMDALISFNSLFEGHDLSIKLVEDGEYEDKFEFTLTDSHLGRRVTGNYEIGSESAEEDGSYSPATHSQCIIEYMLFSPDKEWKEMELGYIDIDPFTGEETYIYC